MRLLLLLACLMAGCIAPKKPLLSGRSPAARVVAQGLIQCFPEGLRYADSSTVYCEASAVTYDGKQLIIASDKAIPGLSAFFATPPPPQPQASLTYFRQDNFLKAIKCEDLSQTPDGTYLLATTGFDRVETDSSRLDAYNVLLAWPTHQPDLVQVIAPQTRQGVLSSLGLRAQLAAALADTRYPQGPPYFKVEGLTVLPGQRLLFGIREIGPHYTQPEYVIRLIAVSYQIREGRWQLGSDFRQIYRFDPDPELCGGRKIGLSSLEYDRFNHRLYLLGSYEEEASAEGIGGFLWVLDINDLETGRAAQPVSGKDGQPLHFNHKPEGIAVLGKQRCLVICDDDKVLGGPAVYKNGELFYRQPQQAAYSVIEWE